MSAGIIKLFEDAELFADQRRLLPAVQAWEEARQNTKLSDRKAWASYNLGVLYWNLLGDGNLARSEFLKCIKQFEEHGFGDYFKEKAARTMHAEALENAMLCSLSFEEFEVLAGKLHRLSPGVLILTGLVPEVRNLNEKGRPWSDQLFDFAGRYYNRNDPKHDIGRYGSARSTYHLILAHRRALRLSREDWRMALYEYCVLSMRMTTDCMVLRGGENDKNSPEEFLPILTETIPLADEYLQQISGDHSLEKVRNDIDQMVNAMRQQWAARSRQSDSKPSNHAVKQSPEQGCMPIFILLLLILIGCICILKTPPSWNLSKFESLSLKGGLVTIIGLAILASFAAARASFARQHMCAACGRPLKKIPQPAYINIPLVITSTDAMRSGVEGVGRECKTCGRIYCSSCENPTMRCECGYHPLTMVRLSYRKI